MARSVLVTGAFGALGAAVARQFAGQGATLGLLDRVATPAWARDEFQAPHLLRGNVDLADAGAAGAAVDQVSEARRRP